MSVVVELSSALLEKAEEATGFSEPATLVERALHQMIRVEAYRKSAAQRGLHLTEEELLLGQEGSFTVIDTYQPRQVAPMNEQEREEHERITAETIRALDEDASLSPEQKAAYLGLIQLGGSEPGAVAAPRRRFW